MKPEHYFCARQILDGKLVSAAVTAALKKKTEKLLEKNLRPPHLAAILIGNDGASETYVASKIKNCAEAGFKSSLVRFNTDAAEEEIVTAIQALNNDASVDGILVQLLSLIHI